MYLENEQQCQVKNRVREGKKRKARYEQRRMHVANHRIWEGNVKSLALFSEVYAAWLCQGQEWAWLWKWGQVWDKKEAGGSGSGRKWCLLVKDLLCPWPRGWLWEAWVDWGCASWSWWSWGSMCQLSTASGQQAGWDEKQPEQSLHSCQSLKLLSWM